MSNFGIKELGMATDEGPCVANGENSCSRCCESRLGSASVHLATFVLSFYGQRGHKDRHNSENVNVHPMSSPASRHVQTLPFYCRYQPLVRKVDRFGEHRRCLTVCESRGSCRSLASLEPQKGPACAAFSGLSPFVSMLLDLSST